MLAAYLQRGRTSVGSQSAQLPTRVGFGSLARNGRPLMSYAAGLWIGVDKMLAPLRETVKI
jgi:hypothetical protein